MSFRQKEFHKLINCNNSPDHYLNTKESEALRSQGIANVAPLV